MTNSTKQSPRFPLDKLSRFFRRIHWFDYWTLGPKLSINLFDNQTESWAWLSSPWIIKSFETFDRFKSFDYIVYKMFPHKSNKSD